MPDGDRRPWALLVTRNFPPLVGGMERVNQHLLQALAPDWQPALCGPSGARAWAPTGTAVVECAIRPLAAFLASSLVQAVRLARRLRPRHVIAGSGLMAPAAWCAARMVGARACVYLHGLDIVVPSRVYRMAWLPFIRAFDIVLANSHNTAALAEQYGVDPHRIRILHPGTDPMREDGDQGASFRQAFELGEREILLSVGRLTRRKGLAEFVASSLPAIVAARPDCMLVVVGDEANDALHGATGGEKARILQAARDAGVSEHVQFVGRCDDALLRSGYSASACHVFPVRSEPGDVEGFGMVALESAAQGLPTAAFAIGGVPDAVLDGVTGELVRAGDYRGFSDAVVRLLAWPRSDRVNAAWRAFVSDRAWPAFGQRLRGILESADD